MNLCQISLPRGPELLTPRANINKKVLAVVTPWLGKAIATGKRIPLPLPAVSHFSASAETDEGTLCMKLWSPLEGYRPERPHLGNSTLMLTFGIARNPLTGDKLWASLLEEAGTQWREPPPAPWCGSLARSEAVAAHPKVTQWLPEFQSSVAFAWL